MKDPLFEVRVERSSNKAFIVLPHVRSFGVCKTGKIWQVWAESGGSSEALISAQFEKEADAMMECGKLAGAITRFFADPE